ncbi:hypothetical protein D3C80_1309110 [compost metagenome]
MDGVEDRRQEHEGELDRLGHAGQEGGQGQGEQHPPDFLAAFGPGRVIHGQTGGGQAEHHDGEEAAHEDAGAGITREEAVQVARRAVEIPDDEPGDVVQDVVQAGDDQQPVEQAIDEQAELTRADDRAAEDVDGVVDAGESQTHSGGHDQTRHSGHDRHEATSRKECQIVGQLEGREAVVAGPGDQAGDDADGHAQPRQGLILEGFRGCRCGVGAQPRDHLGRDRQQDLGRLDRDQETDHARQAGRAIVVPGQTHGDTDGEQQTQIGEDRLTRRRDEGDVEQVRLTQPQ